MRLRRALGALLLAGLAALAVRTTIVRARLRNASMEAVTNLDALVRAAAAYHARHGALPRSPAEAGFAPSGTGRYTYHVEAGGSGLTARAHGDLDRDGTFSTFERTAAVGPGGRLEPAPRLRSDRELE